MDYVITLVHGTFAPSSRWTRAGSRLREHLQAELGNRAHFETFRWGITNNQSRRQASAELLAAQLNRQVESQPQAKHFVIGHSHAGNIALYALRDPVLQSRLHGVVCMNTPFITATKRSQAQIILLPYVFLMFLSFFYAASAGLFILVWCVGDHLSRFGDWIPKNAWGLLPLITAGVLAAGLGLALARYKKSLVGFLGRQQERTLAELALPDVEKPTVLCLRTPNDEVYALFQLLGALAAFPLLLLHPIAMFLFVIVTYGALGPISNEAIFQVLPLFGNLAFTVILGLVLPLAFAVEVIGRWTALLQPVFNLGISVGLLAMTAWGILIIAVAAQTVLLFAMGFRWWAIARTFFVHVGFNEVPVTVHLLRFREFLSPLSFLVHSNPYDNRDALETICSFIKREALACTSPTP